MFSMKKEGLVDELNIWNQQVKRKNPELLERLKQELESKAPNYPEDWAPPSKSPKKEKNRRNRQISIHFMLEGGTA